jgi:hypothetical protein
VRTAETRRRHVVHFDRVALRIIQPASVRSDQAAVGCVETGSKAIFVDPASQ